MKLRPELGAFCSVLDALKLLLFCTACALQTVTVANEPDRYAGALEAKADGEFAQAEHLLIALLAARQDDWQLWFQLGQVQRFQSHWQAALASQKKALVLAPNNDDVRLEIARLYFITEEFKLAQTLVDQILAKHPDYLEAIELDLTLRRQVQERPLQQRWQLLVGAELSRFSQKYRSAWRQSFVQLSGHDNKVVTFLRFEKAERFDVTDEYIEAGLSRRFSSNRSAYLSAGFAQQPLFLPEWRVRLGGESFGERGGSKRLLQGLTLDLQYDRYAAVSTTTIKPGVRLGLTAPLDLHVQIIGVAGEDQPFLTGGAVRANWVLKGQKTRLFIGMADAPESENAMTIQVKSTYLGGKHALAARFDLFWALAYEDREDSYLRKTGSLALSYAW